MEENEKYILKATKDHILVVDAKLSDLKVIAINLIREVAKLTGGEFITHSDDSGNLTIKIVKTKEEHNGQ